MIRIVGHGDIAQALERARPTLKDRLYFASGVSNPNETRRSEFQREKDLLASQPKNSQIMYFSTMSIFTNNSRYVKHKLEMEALVKKFPHWAIVRIGTITWGKNNQHILIPFLRSKVKNKQHIQIRNVVRYIVDESEFIYWVNLTPTDGNWEMNITGRKMTELQIFRKYVSKSYEVTRSDDRSIFSPLLRPPAMLAQATQAGRGRNPSEAEISSHSSSGLRPRFSAKGDKNISLQR